MRPYSEIHLSKSDIRILTALLKSKPKQISKDVRITRTLSIVAIIISAIALLSELGILQLQ